ncbi:MULTISPECIES: type II secretion system F family protein [Sedimentibacter]|uniref:type II secretion system F family protein n=1 Tax=Sedimentibacter TaxID=190972 RepID=UPI0002FB7FBB|nr:MULTISPECIES: type II secretion system F family protein [Sedimentibacter]MEA5094063.1 type II secretion system F family protein [Sedimentibacter saalensis]
MKNKEKKQLTSSELSFFCMQVAMVLKSGMLISDGIEWMYNDIEESNVKNALGVVLDELSNKVPLYKAMENSEYFPTYIISMSQIGSVTGRLEDVMTSLSEYYDREDFIKAKIRNSVFYPSMLFVMMSFVIILLVTKIFPIFEGMIKELGGELPGESSALISFSTGIMAGKFTMAATIAVLMLIAAIFVLTKTKGGKKSFNKFLSSFGPTKSIMKKVTAYRFASSMSLLLSSGMNIDSSMDILLDVTEEPELKNKIEECKTSMNSGENFLDSLSGLSMFSSMHIQMLNMGQRTGEMDIVMKKLTNIYENEADQAISNSVALIEPVLVGILCVVIGFILISVMLPLMNIMSSIG